MVYGFAILLSLIGCVIMYLTKGSLGVLFGASNTVNAEIAKIMPIFLVSVPFVAILRITTTSFYATEKSAFSYLLTFIEPPVYAGAYAFSAAFVRRVGNDLVEYGFCKDFIGIISGYPKEPCR